MTETVSRTKKENDFKAQVSHNTVMPSHQIQRSLGRLDHYTVDAQPQFASNAIDQGQEVYYDTEVNDYPSVKNMYFRFTITPNANTIAAPGQYLIKRLIIESNKGIGDEILRAYPEQNIMYSYLTKTPCERYNKQESQYYKILKDKNCSQEQIGTDVSNYLKSGKSYDIYVEIPLTVIRMNSLDGRLNDELRFRITFNQNWSNQSITLDKTSLMVHSIKQSDVDNIEHIQYNQMNNQKYLYLDVERLQITGTTFTANTQYRADLESFVGDCPFLLVCLKDKNGNSIPINTDQWKNIEIGPSGTIDLENSAGQSLISNGQPMSQNYIYDLMSEELETPRIKGMYLIPFCESIKQSNVGHINGFHTFKGQKDYLSIKFGSAPVSETYTFQCGAAITSGKWSIDTPIRPNTTNTEINDSNDYNLTSNNIALAFDRYYGISGTTCAGDFATTGNVVIAIPGKYGSLIKTYGLPRIINNFSDSCVLNSYVIGEEGFETSNDYILEIYMYYFKCLEINKNGRMTCKKIINGKGYHESNENQPKLSKYRGELLY